VGPLCSAQGTVGYTSVTPLFLCTSIWFDCGVFSLEQGCCQTADCTLVGFFLSTPPAPCPSPAFVGRPKLPFLPSPTFIPHCVGPHTILPLMFPASPSVSPFRVPCPVQTAFSTIDQGRRATGRPPPFSTSGFTFSRPLPGLFWCPAYRFTFRGRFDRSKGKSPEVAWPFHFPVSGPRHGSLVWWLSPLSSAAGHPPACGSSFFGKPFLRRAVVP